MDELMEVFYEEGWSATVVDSEGMGKVLLEHDLEIPLFSSMRKLIEGNKPYNKTIFSIVKDEATLLKMTNKINDITELEKKPGVGFMFVIPVIKCFGYKG